MFSIDVRQNLVNHLRVFDTRNNSHSQAGQGPKLIPGMTFTIEPIINQGKADVKPLQKAGWMIAVTKDRKLSAQWEHTILVTETGYELLTFRQEEEGFLIRAIYCLHLQQGEEQELPSEAEGQLLVVSHWFESCSELQGVPHEYTSTARHAGK